MLKRNLFLPLLICILLFSGLAGQALVNGNQRAESRTKTNAASFQGDLVTGNMCVLGGKASSPFQQRITYDQKRGLYHVKYDSEIYELAAELDPDLALRYSEWRTTNSDLIKHLGYDKRITSYDPGQQALKIDYYSGEERTATKKIGYDGEALDSDLIYLYLRKVLSPDQEKTGGCEVVVKSRGLKVAVTFAQTTTNDLLSFTPQYGCLEEFCAFAEKIKEQGEELDIYVMDLNGIAKWLIPYKYYLAFRQDPPLQLVAYWGGAPKNAEFLYIE